jgi:hypothetical protein
MVILPVADFVLDQLYYGSKIQPVLRAFGLAPVTAGAHVHLFDQDKSSAVKH